MDSFNSHGGKKIVVGGTCAEYDWETLISHAESDSPLSVITYGKAKLELLDFLKSQSTPFLWTRTFCQFGESKRPGRLILAEANGVFNVASGTGRTTGELADMRPQRLGVRGRLTNKSKWENQVLFSQTRRNLRRLSDPLCLRLLRMP